MAAFNKFNQFVLDLAKKKHDLSADTLKIMLTNTAPSATNQVKSDISEVAAGNGYTAGGNVAAFGSLAQTGGVAKLVLTSPTTFAASGGVVGPFRYAVLYNDTQTSPAKPLIGYWDYGAAVSLNDGEQFAVNLDQTNGTLTLN